MKKILFILVLFISFSSFAQTGGGGKNEVHLNVLNIMAFKWLDISYEYKINVESSAGISLSTKFSDKKLSFFDYSRSYAVTPYYRYYISQENASGLFGEVFTMINGGENRKKIEDFDSVEDQEGWEVIVDDEDYEGYLSHGYNDLGFGIGAGYKHVSKMGLTLQAYGGLGRNLFNDNAPPLVIRAGVTIGYRF